MHISRSLYANICIKCSFRIYIDIVRTRWKSYVPKKVNIMIWRAILDWLPTRKNLLIGISILVLVIVLLMGSLLKGLDIFSSLVTLFFSGEMCRLLAWFIYTWFWSNYFMFFQMLNCPYVNSESKVFHNESVI